jgi:SAM-dependent methyltransferase
MIGKLIPKSIQHRYSLWKNKGDKYNCTFCNYGANRFLTMGEDLPVLVKKDVVGGGRREGMCPNCGSFDRERLIHLYLKEIFKIEEKKDLKILHIAPEKRLTNYLLKLDLDYSCGDLFTEGYSYADHVKNMNVTEIPFENEIFDLVICNHVLEHIPNDLDAMKEIYRVLKAGSLALLQVPISNNSKITEEDFSITEPSDREKYYGQFDHVRLYGQDYIDRLNSVGFNVDRVNISKDYEKAGLILKEDIFVCKK